MPPRIGQRCTADGECSRGLSCRSDFFGERGVCTRPCNHGCPVGHECVAEIPDYNGGTIRDMCMLACPTSECAALGSSCDAPGDAAGPRYCF